MFTGVESVETSGLEERGRNELVNIYRWHCFYLLLALPNIQFYTKHRQSFSLDCIYHTSYAGLDLDMLEVYKMKKYQIIYADPPWQLGSMRMKKARPNAKLPYKRMSLEEIKALPINNLADKNCGLFLWTTHTFLPKAFGVMQAWGFKYHCCITWDKTNGIPCWGFKRRTEFILYGYKGKINVNQRGRFIHTLFTEKLTTHSTKPAGFYKILESNTPEPRIELFARSKREGWDVWGNEVESDVVL